ncbi:hypothetical protein SAMN04515621_0959 [Erythrobacter sp. HL-111]|nr:YdbL family protein [Erythrobacter sp. HL-111]KPP95042.1 MAG: hypothetical protein HLUCCO15_03065 [Erythrobacteraceae bacterium HL-111]SDS10197.1 hypothetical protein SAMN04515621_0959 [Erythrobacter sp. HL-111]
MRSQVRNAVFAAAAGAALAVGFAAPAMAQRDPAYAAARAGGMVGEGRDGYLGIVGQPTPELQRLVDDINIKRRAVYARRAQQNNATIEEYAFTAGCQAIAQTAPGEMYEAPDGTWKTRTSAPPERDPRCP